MLAAGIILRNLVRALCVVIAMAAIMLFLAGLLWLSGKEIVPAALGSLLLIPALGLSGTTAMASLKARILAFDRALLVSAIATIGATVPLCLLPSHDYARAGQLAFYAVVATLLGALILVPQLIRAAKLLGGYAKVLKS